MNRRSVFSRVGAAHAFASALVLVLLIGCSDAPLPPIVATQDNEAADASTAPPSSLATGSPAGVEALDSADSVPRQSEFPVAANADDPSSAPQSSDEAPAAPATDETRADPPGEAKQDAEKRNRSDGTLDGEQVAQAAPDAEVNPDAGLRNPFLRQIDIPDFPRDMQWLNTGGPLRKKDLKGKFVILDFWTYCCINCIHILPELKKLEQAYPNQLVVIGVHSAKFETEKGTKNIEEAILRYEIEHPVVNDHEHEIWNMFGVRSWPTVMLVDPQGKAVWYTGGEIQFEDVDVLLKAALPYYRQQGLLDETPLRFDLLAHSQEATPLRFPGKVLADRVGERLFITDSNHNRIVVTSLDGTLLNTIGSGAIGHEDGDFASATFDHPQGLVLHKNVLYVADTENHLLRKVDLESRQVTTIAGQGVQGRNPWLGLDRNRSLDAIPERYVAKPLEAALNSPWALWVHGDDLYIAMAGPHQIWKMPLDESEIGPYAGNGREDIVDGPLLPRVPYQEGYASFAQPSGLTSDGQRLFVADSEGSSIRAVPFTSDEDVTTLVGTADLPHSRLFTFGDQDGKREDVLLQHALGVEYFEGRIFVADTYNNKIKVVDAKSGETKTVAGTGEPGASDTPAQFDEPAGIAYAGGTLFVADTNNHVIRTIDVATRQVATLTIKGLEPPPRVNQTPAPDFSNSPRVKVDPAKVKSADGLIRMTLAIAFPEGWKLNPQAPLNYWLTDIRDGGPIDEKVAATGKVMVDGKKLTLDVPVSGSGKDAVRVALVYYYCQEGGEGVCKMGSVVWEVPLEVGDDANEDVLLTHQVPVTGS